MTMTAARRAATFSLRVFTSRGSGAFRALPMLLRWPTSALAIIPKFCIDARRLTAGLPPTCCCPSSSGPPCPPPPRVLDTRRRARPRVDPFLVSVGWLSVPEPWRDSGVELDATGRTSSLTRFSWLPPPAVAGRIPGAPSELRRLPCGGGAAAVGAGATARPSSSWRFSSEEPRRTRLVTRGGAERSIAGRLLSRMLAASAARGRGQISGQRQGKRQGKTGGG
mmetsp:Transcript_16721/g.46724  ORF Transcript_16721/g.46724 Transcript_16721/m.46724 type:complete len:223 (-) Transcript_16721:7334-8002(-)